MASGSEDLAEREEEIIDHLQGMAGRNGEAQDAFGPGTDVGSDGNDVAGRPEFAMESRHVRRVTDGDADLGGRHVVNGKPEIAQALPEVPGIPLETIEKRGIGGQKFERLRGGRGDRRPASAARSRRRSSATRPGPRG